VTEIVIVPAWRRPGFLAATLRCLAAADDGDLVYWIGLDRGHNREVMRVAQEFVGRFGGRAAIKPRMHPYRGNSYNVLMLYREALEAAPELVHLVEEDIFVGADYYAYHRSAHKLAPSAFAVSAARNQDIPGDPPPVADQVYLAMRYQSIAVSFHPERLDLVVSHMRPDYFRDPINYCRRRFPRTRIPVANAEQDGLINRIVEDQRMHVVYPTQPRAYHAGFVGYHRSGDQIVGTAEQQADRLLAMTTADLNAAAHSYPDHQAIDLGARFGDVTSVISWPPMS
jgi:hypothetical protein